MYSKCIYECVYLCNTYIYIHLQRERHRKIIVKNYPLIIRTFQFQRLCAWECMGKVRSGTTSNTWNCSKRGCGEGKTFKLGWVDNIWNMTSILLADKASINSLLKTWHWIMWKTVQYVQLTVLFLFVFIQYHYHCYLYSICWICLNSFAVVAMSYSTHLLCWEKCSGLAAWQLVCWGSFHQPNPERIWPTLPETNSSPMKITIFPGKYHQNCGFSMAMLVSGRVISMITWETGESCFFQIPTTFDRFTTPFFRVKNCFPARHQCQKFWGARHPGNKCHRVGKGTGPGCCNQQNTW